MTAVPKPTKKHPHKWEGRLCKRCRLVKSAVTVARSCKAKNKFGAKTTVIDGQSFPSRLEARCWVNLRAKEIRGEIKNLTRKATVRFKELGISYQADMKYDMPCLVVTKVDREKAEITVSGALDTTIWVEAKGKESERWRLIKKIWKVHGPGMLEVYKDAGSSGLKLVEIIEPGNNNYATL